MNALIDTINHLIKRHHPFAVYFYPGEREPEIILQQASEIHKLNCFNDLNDNKGFVFAPFFISDHYPLIIIDPDIHLKGFKAIAGLRNLSPPDKLLRTQHTKAANCDIVKSDYLQSLNKLINQINAGKVDKVIMSRTISANISEGHTIGYLFMKLKQSVDNAFVYLVSVPGIGIWMGGTPELLLAKTNGAYQTVSLAGTVPVNGENHEIEWSSGMKREQQIVTDFIANNLRLFKIENYSQSGPFTEYAGNVAHLKTTFEFSGNKIDQQLIPFIAAIHPGPAICGFPKETAKNYILNNEKHQREYYCGFLGNWMMGDELRLFVNIRCMKILDDRAVIYVGGGITSGSVPQSEWVETEHKAKCLLSVVRNN